MPDVKRLEPKDAWDRLHAGSDALLVCAYEDPSACRANALPGALDWTQFANRLSTLPKDREIVLYCA